MDWPSVELPEEQPRESPPEASEHPDWFVSPVWPSVERGDELPCANEDAVAARHKDPNKNKIRAVILSLF
jgi:hypothetical protein